MSSVPAVKQALLDLLNTVEGLDGLPKDWSEPIKHLQPEHLWLGNVEFDEEAAKLGNRSRREEYDLEVIVSVAVRDDNAKAAEERAWEIVALVEAAVRDQHGLGLGPVLAQIAGKRQSTYATDTGRACDITVTVAVIADI